MAWIYLSTKVDTYQQRREAVEDRAAPPSHGMPAFEAGVALA
ncbi:MULTISPECIES: hypothetical protein [Stenotrophomonas]|nr:MULTISPECIES: hypothetical protein [Stenotrophomonas]